jgi:hypothetical protein
MKKITYYGIGKYPESNKVETVVLSSANGLPDLENVVVRPLGLFMKCGDTVSPERQKEYAMIYVESDDNNAGVIKDAEIIIYKVPGGVPFDLPNVKYLGACFPDSGFTFYVYYEVKYKCE